MGREAGWVDFYDPVPPWARLVLFLALDASIFVPLAPSDPSTSGELALQLPQVTRLYVEAL